MQAQSKDLVKRYLKSQASDEKLSLKADEVRDLMVAIHSLVVKDVTESNQKLYEDIRELASFIESFKQDLCSLFVDDVKANTMDLLDIVLKTTEEAVENILECAEKIDSIAQDAPADLGERLSSLSTRIYEASNFQDLNGQRIIKVIKVLNTLEEKINQIMEKIGVEKEGKSSAAHPHQQEQEKPENETLMNGPQSPGQAVSQDEIDRLLADL